MLSRLCLLFMCCIVCGCASAKPAPKEAEGDQVGDLMDGAIPSRDRRTEDTSMVVIPLASKDSAIVIDGSDEEWEEGVIREFASKDFIVKGGEFWRGAQDLSVKVGVKGDQNYVYFWVAVHDDKLVAKGGSDTVTLWLHDPELAALKEKIPQGFATTLAAAENLGLRWDPGSSGVALLGTQREELGPEELEFKKARTSQGWAIEAKVAIEALGLISDLPLTSVAFALEVSDGDDPGRPGPQSVMHIFPDVSSNMPHFARVALSGMLPHHEATTPQGLGGGVLGFWQFEGQQWRYVPLDSTSSLWRPMHDAQELQESLRTAPGKVLSQQCATATHDLHVVKSFELAGKPQRTALLLCAARQQERGCPASAQSTVLLVSLHPKDSPGQWEVRKGVKAFDAPLAQCLTMPAPQAEETALYDTFSLLPLDFLDDEMWAIGWHLTRQGEQTSESSQGISFATLSPKAKGFEGFLTGIWPRQLRSNGTDQSLETSQFYFVQLDGKKGLDLCEVQTRELRECKRFERDCVLAPNGKTRHTLIKMWNQEKRVLEDSLNPAHKRCLYDFSKAPTTGYILLHTGTEVGVVKMED